MSKKTMTILKPESKKTVKNFDSFIPMPVINEKDKQAPEFWLDYSYHPANNVVTLDENGKLTANTKRTSPESVLSSAMAAKQGPWGGFIANLSDTFFRESLLQRGPGGGNNGWIIDITKDIDGECGYPRWISPWQYRYLYDREKIARRICDLPVDECWVHCPDVYEDEDSKISTPFEQGVVDTQKKHNVYGALKRLDKQTRIAYYGIALIGLDDNPDMSQPVIGIHPKTGELLEPDKPLDHKLLYIKTFDETQVRILSYESDPNSPRYMQPYMYFIRFVDVVRGENASVVGTATRSVHWTRILHNVDEQGSNNIFGSPGLQGSYNRVYDLRKILSGSGEMYWKGALPGLSFEINPEIAAAGGGEFNEEDVRQEFIDYQAGLQRYLALKGLTVKSLAPQVKSPKEFFETQCRAICIGEGYPIRIFMGTEQQQRTDSTEESKAWNRTMAARQNGHCIPDLVRKFWDMMLLYGCVPPLQPKIDKITKKQIPGSYIATFPDLNTISDKDKADLSFKRTQALAQYINGFVYLFVSPRLYLINFLYFTAEQADDFIEEAGGEKAIIEALKKHYDKLSNSLDGGVQVKSSPSAGDGKKKKSPKKGK